MQNSQLLVCFSAIGVSPFVLLRAVIIQFGKAAIYLRQHCGEFRGEWNGLRLVECAPSSPQNIKLTLDTGARLKQFRPV